LSRKRSQRHDDLRRDEADLFSRKVCRRPLRLARIPIVRRPALQDVADEHVFALADRFDDFRQQLPGSSDEGETSARLRPVRAPDEHQPAGGFGRTLRAFGLLPLAAGHQRNCDRSRGRASSRARASGRHRPAFTEET
jgi:hypothetical protein